jgi:threonine dehydratase
MLDILGLVMEAQKRIRPFVRFTPLEPSADLGRENGGAVFLKLENIQHTGSFKVRGAFNRLLTLNDDQRRAGIITASSGNHGLAVAFGMQRLGVAGTIYVPEDVSSLKAGMLEKWGGVTRGYGADCGATEAHARRQAERAGHHYISPYNDPLIVGGQGTIGLEILDRLPNVDCIMVSVGGGGLIAGIAGAVKANSRAVRIVGCLPANSPVMAACVRAGRIVDVDIKPTLSDGTAGGVEHGAITLEPCRDLVDDWVLVSEAEIEDALVRVFDHHRLVIEGAAAVTVAGFLKMAPQLSGKTVALVICGGNIHVDAVKRLVCPRFS